MPKPYPKEFRDDVVNVFPAGRTRARRGAYSSLPDGNPTTDQQIAAVADRDRRMVITKDVDFCPVPGSVEARNRRRC